MKELFVLIAHLLTTLVRLAQPGRGERAVVSDALEAARQDVLQRAVDELGAGTAQVRLLPLWPSGQTVRPVGKPCPELNRKIACRPMAIFEPNSTRAPA